MAATAVDDDFTSELIRPMSLTMKRKPKVYSRENTRLKDVEYRQAHSNECHVFIAPSCGCMQEAVDVDFAPLKKCCQNTWIKRKRIKLTKR